MTTNKHILFTGAGFSKNFGLPLAKEVWGVLFNNIKVKNDKVLNQLFHDEQNYEIIYDFIRREHPKKLLIINQLLQNLFCSMDDIFINYITNNKNSFQTNSFYEFLNRFSLPSSQYHNDYASIFTLNQDLIVERFLRTRSEHILLITPSVTAISHRQPNQNITISTRYSDLNEIYIQDNQPSEKPSVTSYINYVKLHGSFNWKRKVGDSHEEILLIGKNKINDIEDDNLLKKYFDIFENSLKKANKVLCVGYSFNDKHVNSLFVKYNIELHVLNPSPPDTFINFIANDKDEDKKTIWKHRITNYYQGDLHSLFSDDHSTYNDLKSNYFDL